MKNYNKPLQALIVAEDDARARTLEQGLGDGSVIAQRILLTADLLPRIVALDPDVILVDLAAPDRDRFEQILDVARTVHRPIVMFVDATDHTAAQAAADAGIAAFVVDGLRRERVKPVLEVAIARYRAFAKLSTELNAARDALEERKLIEQAKSFLMEQKGLAEHEAYALMRRAAMNQGIKLAQIARSLLTAAQLVAGRESK